LVWSDIFNRCGDKNDYESKDTQNNVMKEFLFRKKKQKARASHPKIGDLNFINAEEKTPSPTAR